MDTFQWVLAGVLLVALPTFFVLLRINAPYGKYDRAGWGPGVDPRLGWCLMEAPALMSFLWFYATGPHATAPVAIVLCVGFAGHYLHRSIVYPLLIRPGRGTEIKILIILLADVFNIANGYLNGAWLSRYATPLYSLDWFRDPRFVLGALMFAGGLLVNKQSEMILRRLRSGSRTDYAIPFGGAFRFVSSPHYLGELLQWTGFALASWSPAAVGFVVFSSANLVPRALATHRWYQQKFADYPANRKAIIPWVL